MTQLSIVVPVYGVEQTLDRCVSSIVGQTFVDWQLILVDDGSPDGCPSMCDEWARRDSRILALHQANGGLSSARNTGIAHAEGEYITFVDSDDWVAPDTYRQLLDVLAIHPDYDLLEYPFTKVDTQLRPVGHLKLADRAFTSARDYWLQAQAYRHSYAWNKIYRRRLFHSVAYPEGRLFEDMHTLPALIGQARTIATTQRGSYLYLQNPLGITAQAGAAEWLSLLDAHAKAIDQLQLLNTMDAAESEYYMDAVNIQLYYSAISHTTTPRLPSRKASRFCQHEPLPLRLKRLTLNTIGLKGLCQLYTLIDKIDFLNILATHSRP